MTKTQIVEITDGRIDGALITPGVLKIRFFHTDSVERVTMAIAKAIHGQDFDPSTVPEVYDYCKHLAQTALSAMVEGKR